jgi:flagellar hook-associated protein 2
VNAALGEIARQTSVGTVAPDGTRTGQGVLAGSSLLRDLSMQLVSQATDLVGGKAVSAMGLQVARDGTLTLDADALLDRLTTDPASVRQVFAPADPAATSISSRLAALAKTATQSGTGTISLAIDGQNSMIKDLTNRIADWDVRLQARRESLQRTYSALEVSLSQMKSQSTWLAGQLSSLPSTSSGS